MAIHPGETLKDILESANITQEELSCRTGISANTIKEIVEGNNSVSPDFADKLSIVFGMSENFWNNLQKNYEETHDRVTLSDSCFFQKTKNT